MTKEKVLDDMATIKEDYCSKELSLLLDKKGFDGYSTPYSKLVLGGLIPHSVAMKWLREVHNLCIEPYRTACGYLYTISTIPYGSCKCNPKKGGDDKYCGQWTTYEGANEAAIKYCLEHLI